MTARSIRRALERKREKDVRKREKEVRKSAKEAREAAAASAPIETLEHDNFSESDTPAETSPRLSANRANAQLSSGPRTSEGKLRSSMNALKSGLTGRTVLMPGDDVTAYATHVAGYELQYQPVGQRECDLVQSIADANWRLKRIPSLEYALYTKGQLGFRRDVDAAPSEDIPADLLGPISELEAYLTYEKQLRNLHLQESRLHRRQTLDLAELNKLQTERARREQSELDLAAELYEAAEANAASFDPAEFGFEFSIPQIKRHVALRQVGKAPRPRPSTPNFNAQETSKLTSQAA